MMFQDCISRLSGIAYKDDKQIISAEIYKNYAEDAKVSVWIYEVGNE